jgi:predicted Rossmann fold nucleotide-binding protein DprA/Smf involved in DNA uptake
MVREIPAPMPAKHRQAQGSLEVQLNEITREFVAKIVSTIRNASFAEVAGYGPLDEPAGAKKVTSRPAISPTTPSGAARKSGRKPRQTPEKKAELLSRIVNILAAADEPLAVRAIARETGAPADALAGPLLELRDQGKVRKHGDKRSTTYSLA